MTSLEVCIDNEELYRNPSLWFYGGLNKQKQSVKISIFQKDKGVINSVKLLSFKAFFYKKVVFNQSFILSYFSHTQAHSHKHSYTLN